MNKFPVLASTISPKALGKFAKETYGLNNDFECKLFRTGMNHTYFISNNKTTYVLRVYSHNWRSKAEILEELNLLNLLKENNLSVSFSIPAKNGTFIQEINAPEGIRYVVLFSFAKGEKIRFINPETCAEIGALMGRFHELTFHKKLDRISYTKQTLLEVPYKRLKDFFAEELPAMKMIKEFKNSFNNADFENISTGIVHLDIWYDNMAITKEQEITIFDFDFCGNGAQILDIGYFCKQLFFIETDKKQYELKLHHFLKGYQKVRKLSDKELQLIPIAGAAIYIFYLGVQAQRFDWSNIFLTENYLKMYVDRITTWLNYYKTAKIKPANTQR